MNILYLILLTVTENSALKLLFYLFIYLGFALSLSICICLLIWAICSFVRLLILRLNLFTWFHRASIYPTFIYLKIDVCLFLSYVSLFFIHFIFRFPFDCSDRSDCVLFFLYCSTLAVAVVVCSFYFHF